MGMSMSWIAVETGDPDAVCGEIGLVRTGDQGGFMDFPTGGATTPSGWYVVLFDDPGTAHDCGEALARISEKGQAVRCAFIESTMFSLVEGWAGGKMAWSVTHDRGEGLYALDVRGDPPGDFAAIRDEHAALQDAEGGASAGVDYIFDVPLELAKKITGYRVEDFEGDDPRQTYEGLEPL